MPIWHKYLEINFFVIFCEINSVQQMEKNYAGKELTINDEY